MTPGFFRPDYAHVPGQTPRHPEALFDPIRASVSSAMTEAELAGSLAFITGLTYLDEGYFWEAHEVLEPVWMACPPESPARHCAQALIQIANAALKQSMGRENAVRRILVIVDTLLAQAGTENDRVLGMTIGEIRDMAQTLVRSQ